MTDKEHRNPDLDAAFDPVKPLLDGLTEEQRKEIVEEVGDRTVERLKEKNQEKFLQDLEASIIGNLPIVSKSRLVQNSIRIAVRQIFDEQTEDMIQDAGDVVVKRLVEAHADALVEDVMRTSVRKMQEES